MGWTSGLLQDQQQKLLLCVSQQQMMFDKQMVAFKTIRGSWDNLVVAALLFPILVKELWSVHKKTSKISRGAVSTLVGGGEIFSFLC